MSPKQLRAHKIATEVAVVSLVPPEKLRLARKRIQAAADAGSIDLSDQLTSDWRWAITDERILDVIDLLRKENTLNDVSVPPGQVLTVIGDLHGQYWDFMNLLKMAGRPSPSSPW